MKIRNDFVTNSSSSSFIISKSGLTAEQIQGLLDPYETTMKLKDHFICASHDVWQKYYDEIDEKGLEDAHMDFDTQGRILCPSWATSVEDYVLESGGWGASDQGDNILIGTSMDNFDITDLFKLLNIPDSNIIQNDFID